MSNFCSIRQDLSNEPSDDNVGQFQIFMHKPRRPFWKSPHRSYAALVRCLPCLKLNIKGDTMINLQNLSGK